jgi:cytochrome P450
MTATQAKTAASRETATGHEVGAESQSHRARPASSVPGPRAPRLVQSWLGINHPLAVRLWARRRFGPIFRTNDAIVGEMFHVADRDLVAEMFKWKPAEYNVGEPREIMEPALGSSSMLLLDGDRHLRMRKLMLPPFHGEAIATYRELIEQITNREVDRWRPGDTIRARGVAQTITMEVIIRAVFGISDPERVAELKRLLPRLASINPLLGLTAARRDLGPRSPWGAFLRARERADEMIYEEIERRRRANADGDRHDDILALLLSARDEEGQPLSDKELRDELITILLAGHETTATSIAWAFERLLRTPQTLERLTDEVKHGDGEEYLEAVIKETLRVRPVVIDVFRAPTEPIELGRLGSSSTTPRSILSPRRSGRNASWKVHPSHTLGCRSVAACGAASVPPSRS